jgi:hypothetical protein
VSELPALELDEALVEESLKVSAMISAVAQALAMRDAPAMDEGSAVVPAVSEAPAAVARKPELRQVSASTAGRKQTADTSGRASAAAGCFEVPLALVWKLWTEAYQQIYGRPYVQTGADRSASLEVARACATAVLHREQEGEEQEREARAQEYLRHVYGGFLRRAGRNDFLRQRRHPLFLLPSDLNELGEGWVRGKKQEKKAEEARPQPPPLPREEQMARCQALRRALASGRPAARPRIVSQR